MTAVLAFREISKVFRSRGSPPKIGLDRLSLEISPGEIVGFLGPNGAGKTTALHLALGFLKSTSGSGDLFGKPLDHARSRRQLGFVPDQPVFFPGTAAQALAMAARFSGAALSSRQLEEHLQSADLQQAKGDVRNFSRGTQQRLALEQALVHRPQLILLDEPVSALDPRATMAVLERLKQLRAEGVSVLLSSHQLEAVATIADRLLLLDQGRLLLSGRPADLMAGSGMYQLTFRNLPSHITLPSQLITRDDVIAVYHCNEAVQPRIIQLAWQQGAELIAVQPVIETLTQLFLRVTARSSASGTFS